MYRFLVFVTATALAVSAQVGLPTGTPASHNATAKYVSRPDLIPANWNVTYKHPHVKPAEGYVFLSPVGSDPLGTQIFTHDGELVYLNNSGVALGSNNFYTQEFHGNPVLTFWQGPVNAGHSLTNGTNIILNADYTLNRTLHPKHTNDLHEFAITKNNTALATYYVVVKDQSLSGIHGNVSVDKGVVIDGCFREIDLHRDEVIFDFCPHKHNVDYSLSYLPITEKPTNASNGWDWFHINAVDKDDLGNYLISSRNLHTLFYIDGHSKEVLWRLGGKNSTFSGDGTHFAWQHFGRWLKDDHSSPAELVQRNKNGRRTLSLFDNGSDEQFHNEKESGGRVIELDFEKKTAKLIRRYWHLGHSNSALAVSQGSFLLLSNYTNLKSDHAFVGFGAAPVFAEFTEDGHPVQVVRFGGKGEMSYRVFKNSWKGTPLTAPDVALRNNSLYVSWNGATEVRKWAVVQSHGSHVNRTIVSKAGFETRIRIARAPLTHVEALGMNGTVLSKSAQYQDNGRSIGGAVAGKWH